MARIERPSKGAGSNPYVGFEPDGSMYSEKYIKNIWLHYFSSACDVKTRQLTGLDGGCSGFRQESRPNRTLLLDDYLEILYGNLPYAKLCESAGGIP